MLRVSGGAGGSKHGHSYLIRPRSGGGPLGGGAGRLWGGGAGSADGGGGPGQSVQNQEEHAGPTAPQRHQLLPQSGQHVKKTKWTTEPK